MDPSIIKLMEDEENEDESMHSSADVEAFQAALNRGIGGGDAQPSVFSSETNQKQQVAPLVTEIKRNDVKQPRDNVQQSPLIQISDRIPMRITEPERVKILGAQSQYLNQQNMGVEQRSNQKNQGNSLLLASLLPVLKAYLDKDRYMQLQTLFNRLRKGEIVKEEYVRLMKSVAGDHVLRAAIAQLQSQLQPGPNQSQLHSQASAPQRNVRMPVSAIVSSAVQVQAYSSYPSAENNAQKPREMECHPHSHGMQGSQFSSSSTCVFSQDIVRSSISEPGRSKQQHLQFQQNSFTMCSSNSGTYQPYSGPNVNTSGSSMKPQSHDLGMKKISHPIIGATEKGGSTQAMTTINLSKFERPNYVTDPKRVQSGSLHTVKYQNPVPWLLPTKKEKNSAPFSSTIYVKQGPVEQDTDQQQKSLLSNSQGFSASPVERGTAVTRNLKDDSLEKQSSKVGFSTPSSMESSNTVSASIATQMDPNIKVGSLFPSVAASAGVNARTPPKKASIGEKKLLEALGFSPPLSSKKQKVSGAFLDQSIEQLNDVTAVSGVNLREEEELLSGSMKDSRISEASRRAVQKEEERLILQKTPLQKKLAEIMVKCGLKNINRDVERCLSFCVEERMRGLISTLITLSKQRVDIKKPRHPTVMASNVRQQILTTNQKAREEWGKKQAEAEMLQKVNEPEGDNRVEVEKEKDKGRVKLKAGKEEDDKMRTTAANVAARVAVGGDDMLSKWQLMAEQARQKHEDGKDAASGSQSAKDDTGKPLSTSGKTMKDGQEPEKRNHAVTSKVARKFGRNQAIAPLTMVSHSISVKDVISALEREPQMSKSTLIYQLYERTRSNALIE